MLYCLTSTVDLAVLIHSIEDRAVHLTDLTHVETLQLVHVLISGVGGHSAQEVNVVYVSSGCA